MFRSESIPAANASPFGYPMSQGIKNLFLNPRALESTFASTGRSVMPPNGGFRLPLSLVISEMTVQSFMATSGGETMSEKFRVNELGINKGYGEQESFIRAFNNLIPSKR